MVAGKTASPLRAVVRATALLLIACLVSLATASKDYLKKEHSLQKPYPGLRWDFTGTTVITALQCRITADQQSQQGSLWNNVPVTAHNWEMHIHFKIHGRGTGNLQGDGMAIWYARDRMKPGPVFGNEDYFHGLAVIMDSYSNQNVPHRYAHPYVSAMMNNGSLHYDHDHDGESTKLAGCHSKFRNKQHDTLIAIRYKDNVLRVSLDIDNKDMWEECFSVSNVHLPTGYYLGMSAATGDLSDNHDIVSVKFYELDSLGNATDYNKVQPHAPAPVGVDTQEVQKGFLSDFGLLQGLFVIVLIAALVAVAYVLYQRSRAGSPKNRFY